MKRIISIEAYEDVIQYDDTGNVVHHPLNGVYFSKLDKEIDSHGYLSFGGRGLAGSSILDDIRVYTLFFRGEVESETDREAWAESLRAEVLRRLCREGESWYIGVLLYWSSDMGPSSKDIPPECFPVGDQTGANSIERVVVRSEKPFWLGYGHIEKPIFEVRCEKIPAMVKRIWPHAIEGIPIEGYLFESNNIELIKQWNREQKNDTLFREVMDKVKLAFYTFPLEHRHFAFVTNKFSLGEFKAAVNIEKLKSQAQIIGEAYFKKGR